MTTPTLDQFKRFSADIAPAARAVLMARVFAEMERERVNAYILPIFARYGFVAGDIAGAHAGEPIDRPDRLYLCTDEARVREYFDECDAAHRAHGFTGPKDHCPALVAESLVMKAEHALIDLASGFFGVEFHGLYGDNRARLLDLIIGGALKAESEGR